MRTSAARLLATRRIVWLVVGLVAILPGVGLWSKHTSPRTPRQWFDVALRKGVYGEDYQGAAFLSKREFLAMALRELQKRESRLAREYRLIFPMLPKTVLTLLPVPVPPATRHVTAFATIEMLILADSGTLSLLAQEKPTIEQLLKSDRLEVSQSAALMLFVLKTGEPRVLTHAACDYLQDSDFLVRLCAAFRCIVPGQTPRPTPEILKLGLPILNELMTNTAQIDQMFGPAAPGWRRGALSRIQNFRSDAAPGSPN